MDRRQLLKGALAAPVIAALAPAIAAASPEGLMELEPVGRLMIYADDIDGVRMNELTFAGPWVPGHRYYNGCVVYCPSVHPIGQHWFELTASSV